MTPAEVRSAFEGLDADKRALSLALLCDACLHHLRKYFADSGTTRYRDSIVGLRHEVDVDLPSRVLAAIRSARGIPPSSALECLQADYQEPIAAHQDDDFKITDARADYAYLAIYNLVRSCRNPDDKNMAWLVVRQALSALGQEDPTGEEVIQLLSRWVEDWASA